ncbi:hypothetical protein Mal15_62940 [Stieleria maiorica]|uniref:DUF115 domain-containing protein n=1 Tax=Stieleria maiorica TaxID=2795974 RepID=A0A5B9MLJ2_9BACT|nr:hypothetical protein [Stieleria maiorica]QEG02209.1 hypothetical protein Mal15_62940 [Stieleria maiorica]
MYQDFAENWGPSLARRFGLEQPIVDQWHDDLQLPKSELGHLPDWVELNRATRSRIARCKEQWSGETVVCVGNGPSINQMDLSCLDGALIVGTNRAYQLLDRFTPREFHLVVQDNQRVAELGQDLRQLKCPLHLGNIYYDQRGVPPEWVTPKMRNLSVYMPRLRWQLEEDQLEPIPDFEPGFSSDPTQFVYYGFSVIFSAIQFAAYFGAARIVCIGIDMDYDSGTNFVPGVNVTWDGFSYEYHAKPMFELIDQKLRKSGIEFINATPRGKVDAIDRMPLAEALSRKTPRLAA